MTDRNGSLSNYFLKLSDLSLLLLSLGLAIVLRYAPGQNPTFVVDYLSERIKVTNALLGFGLLFSWHAAFAVQGLYVSHRLRPLRLELKEVGRAVLISSVLLLVGANVGSWPTINVRTVATFGLMSFVLIGTGRFCLRANLRRLRRRGHNVKTLLLVGGGARGRRFAAQINLRQDLGYRVLGFVDSDSAFAGVEMEGAPWMGTIEDLPRILTNEVIDEVAIALPIKSQYSQIEAAVMLLEEQGITTHLLSDLFPQKLARSQSTDLDGLPLVSLHSAPMFSWRTEAKRIFDFVSAILLLLIAAPALLLVAVLIKLETKGPIFFVQERVGLNKRRFRMLKFRTMQRDAESRMSELEHLNEKSGPIFKIRNDPRITSVGRWLRRTSIDELPQLVNVLLGDMSIVGPRPLSVRDATRMELAWQKRRFSVKPGLTCLWQVSGRSNLSFEQWMQLDLEYIDRWSLGLDASILLRTIPAIVLARGAS
ncbi:MAG TPA: sugar transferase [Pyrinomonadaceae bacterium]|nr:sugar transferase [Pyrinomonadaceae bacterium]